MWRIVVLVFCIHVASQAQPTPEEPSSRLRRELIECCPCPGKGPESLAGARVVDDCPCRGRSADSDGASSLLFPTRAAGRRNPVPFMRSNADKDEIKNLLQPEVGLAASMLQTLREATEEEYQDALARDAARDAAPEESRNLVIIVKPRTKDDFISEASTVKEERCIHPLGRARTPLRTLPNILGQSLPRKSSPWLIRDTDSGTSASNLQENVVDNGLVKPRPLLRLGTPLKDALKIISLDNMRNRPNLFERHNIPLIRKGNLDKTLRKPTTNDQDLNISPSNIQEQTEPLNENDEHNLIKRPMLLKNLLNQKNVDLIRDNPPKRPILKSNVFNSGQVLNEDDCDSTYDSQMNEDVLLPKNNLENEALYETNLSRDNLNHKPIEKSVKFEEDGLTSPSEFKPTFEPSPSLIQKDEDVISSEESIEFFSEPPSNLQENSGTDETLNPNQLSEVEVATENEQDLSIIREADEISAITNDNLDGDDLDIDSKSATDSNVNFQNNDSPEIITPVQERDSSEFLLENNNDIVDEQANDLESSPLQVDTKINSKQKILPPLSETLLNIRDNVKKSLDNLKKKPLNTDPVKLDELKSVPIIKKPELVTESQAEEPSVINETPDQATFKELEKLSTDLLVLSSNEQTVNSKENIERGAEISSEEHNEILVPDLGSREAITSAPGLAEIDITKNNACKLTATKREPEPNPQSNQALDRGSSDMSSEASAPSANIVPALLDPFNLNKKLGSSLFQNINPLDPLNLGEKLGSLPTLDPLNIREKLRSPGLPILDPLNLSELPLLPILDPLDAGSAIRDIIVQPRVLGDPLDPFTKPITDVLKIPTLEDLRDGLESLLDTKERRAENNISDDENCSTEMASAASNNVIKIPKIKPLQDLNVDLFQLNPLSSSQPNVLSNLPSLNLNNFRTKLPVPKNLELKPVKLESRVANNKGNVLGASLTFGDKKHQKPKPQSLLGHPLGTLPTFDELRNSLHAGTHNILGSGKSSLDLLKNSNFPTSGLPDIDEIRRNAAKTIKGLQKRMKSTLNVGVLDDKLSNPQELLEDVSDKLKAIHYDLNDRLSSFHDDLIDKTKIKPLSISRNPVFTVGRNSNKEHNTNRKLKVKPLRLQTSASTISSQESDPFDNENESNLRSPVRGYMKRLNFNPQKGLVGAESSPVPSQVELPTPRKSIELPKLSTLPPLSQRLSTLPSLKDIKRPLLRKPSFLEKSNKVTISFGSTTPAPVTSPLENYRKSKTNKPLTTVVKEKPKVKLFKETLTTSHPNTFEPKSSALESTPSRISIGKPKNNFKTANLNKDIPQFQSTIEKTKPSLKVLNADKSRFAENMADMLKSSVITEASEKKVKSPVKPLVWPKSSEDSFLAKVREAMQARLANFDPKKPSVVNIKKSETHHSSNPNIDMLKSASENNEVVEAPLKESVPYKCRMVCTRE